MKPYGEIDFLSPLYQVMDCCLMTPRHYLATCWLVINKAQPIHIHLMPISQDIPQPSITKFCLKITYQYFKSSRADESNHLPLITMGAKTKNRTKQKYTTCTFYGIRRIFFHESFIAYGTFPHLKSWFLSMQCQKDKCVKLCKYMFVNSLSSMLRDVS